MRIASRTLLYAIGLFVAFYGAAMLGVAIESLLSVALTGAEDVRASPLTLLAGCIGVGFFTALVLEDL
jgi:hypothetical protein